MPLTCTVQPQVEPVSLAEAKQWLRVRDGETSQDSLIEALIQSSREYGELVTVRAFITQTWKYTLDGFPAGPSFVQFGEAYGIPGNAILLQKSPVQSVTSIRYMDTAGSWQTLTAGTDYVADLTSEPARITPPFGKVWPINLPQIASVEVVFVAGYGDGPELVPAGIRRWMQLRMATMFENREEFIVGTRLAAVQLPFVDRMLDTYRVVMV